MWRAAVWQGARFVGLITLPLGAIGAIGPQLWKFSLLWFAAVLPFGMWVGVRHYVRSRRDQRLRAKEPELRPVEIGRWRKLGLIWRRGADLAGAEFTLSLRPRMERLTATLTGPDGTERVQLPRWLKEPGVLRHQLEKQSKAGEYLDGDTRQPLAVWLHGREITVRRGRGPLYQVTRHAIRLGDRSLTVRDTLGWRVPLGLTDEEATICALALLTGLPDAL
ncbi:hypothetical protein [Streptomyces profundus]|uniref:hypothetical protein n=1 Tax=Streptomyces profundus TaxID=2867410 RepID=UPI001D16CE31|nr:hypothetical protein [Streptomyces sp. MA3_2.13]UED86414.1 hypothetical protein K4G22_21300 [Streptomyces sp. MA3_2.13]